MCVNERYIRVFVQPRLLLSGLLTQYVIRMLLSHTVDTHSLASLHTILSTGSPLMGHNYDYVYSCIKSDLLLGSITGKLLMMVCCLLHRHSVIFECGFEV